jgi:hypothetical protein
MHREKSRDRTFSFVFVVSCDCIGIHSCTLFALITYIKCLNVAIVKGAQISFYDCKTKLRKLSLLQQLSRQLGQSKSGNCTEFISMYTI